MALKEKLEFIKENVDEMKQVMKTNKLEEVKERIKKDYELNGNKQLSNKTLYNLAQLELLMNKEAYYNEETGKYGGNETNLIYFLNENDILSNPIGNYIKIKFINCQPEDSSILKDWNQETKEGYIKYYKEKINVIKLNEEIEDFYIIIRYINKETNSVREEVKNFVEMTNFYPISQDDIEIELISVTAEEKEKLMKEENLPGPVFVDSQILKEYYQYNGQFKVIVSNIFRAAYSKVIKYRMLFSFENKDFHMEDENVNVAIKDAKYAAISTNYNVTENLDKTLYFRTYAAVVNEDFDGNYTKDNVLEYYSPIKSIKIEDEFNKFCEFIFKEKGIPDYENYKYEYSSKLDINSEEELKKNEEMEKNSVIEIFENEETVDYWSPEPDWWDIESIVSKDNVNYPEKEYPGAIIALIDNTEDQITFPQDVIMYNSNDCGRIEFSDGTVWNSVEDAEAEGWKHVWDKTKDKDCSKGYKTRYVCFYYFANYFDWAYNNVQNYYSSNCLYLIFKRINYGHILSNTSWSMPKLQAIKIIENKRGDYIEISSNSYSTIYFNLPELKAVIGGSLVYTDANTDGRLHTLSYCSSSNSGMTFKMMKKMIYNTYYHNKENIEKVKINIRDRFNGNCVGEDIDIRDMYANFGPEKITQIGIVDGPRTLKWIDFGTITTMTNGGCRNLEDITEIVNIKSNNNWFNHNTVNKTILLKVIDALENYGEGSTATDEEKAKEHKLTIGAENLAKLTETEIAVGTNKGWTIA